MSHHPVLVPTKLVLNLEIKIRIIALGALALLCCQRQGALALAPPYGGAPRPTSLKEKGARAHHSHSCNPERGSLNLRLKIIKSDPRFALLPKAGVC